jgi:hypothetical protein
MFGMQQLACGLLSGLIGSIFVNTTFMLLGEPALDTVLGYIGFTTIAVLSGFFMSRKAYGLPGLFEDAQ